MNVIDEYLQGLASSQRAALERVRAITLETVPSPEEVISYGMPVIKQDGKYILGFCAFKDHLSIFPGSEPIEALKDRLSDLKTSKGTVQFTLDHPIPDQLLKDIVTVCLAVAAK